jgi:hypothetical protein
LFLVFALLQLFAHADAAFVVAIRLDYLVTLLFAYWLFIVPAHHFKGAALPVVHLFGVSVLHKRFSLGKDKNHESG